MIQFDLNRDVPLAIICESEFLYSGYHRQDSSLISHMEFRNLCNV